MPLKHTIPFQEVDNGDMSRLIVTIENTQPVELLDMAKSMMSMADDYRAFIRRHDELSHDNDVKLFIKEVRRGSIVQELAAIAPLALPFIEHSNSVVEYAKHLKGAFSWLLGGGARPEEVDKSTLKNLSEILDPVAKDLGSKINFDAINVNGDMVLNIHVNSLEANAVQNQVRREIDALKEPAQGFRQGAVMYWVQARGDVDKKAGDKAKIESIYGREVKVKFVDDELKQKMLYDLPHPFDKAFVVDVAVETIDEKPIFYIVQKLHEIIDRP